VRRYALAIVVLLAITACGKKVPVTSRSTGSIARSELEGLATYYAEPFHGRRTASGEVFDSYGELTAAHRTLPFNTVVKVTNQSNGRDVEVRINDRGPFVDGRVIDLSARAAREIDMVRAGTVPVKLTIIKAAAAVNRGVSPAPSPSSSPVYTIQVGAFETQTAAEALQKKLQERYNDVTVQTFSTTRTLYRVRVGRLADLASAEKLARQLRDEQFDPFVVRVN
jgi:rare lipoprotein A